MDSYEKLKNLIKTNQLKLYFVLSLPRSRSTALNIAITEAPEIHGQLSEPFVNADLPAIPYYSVPDGEKVRTFDQGCHRILKRVEELIKSTNGYPIRLLIHAHFSYLLKGEVSRILDLTRNIIISVREPKIQLLSYVVAFLNTDLGKTVSIKFNGSSVLNIFSLLERNETKKLLDLEPNLNRLKVTRHSLWGGGEALLNTIVRETLNTIIHDAKEAWEIAWDNMKHCLEEIIASDRLDQLNIVLVDGNNLVKMPEETLEHLAQNLEDITFNPSMTNGWKKATGVNYRCCRESNNDPNETWMGLTRNSSGLTTENDSVSIDGVPYRENFPQLLQESLDKTYQIYHSLFSINKFKYFDVKNREDKHYQNTKCDEFQNSFFRP